MKINKEQREERRDARSSRRKLNLYEGRRVISQTLFGKRKSRRTFTAKTRHLFFIWGVLSLPIVKFFVFWLYVNTNSILMAFKNIDYAAGGVEYWTLDNFKQIYKMFTEPGAGTDLAHYGMNTLKYWLLSVALIPQSIFLTYLFQKKLKGHKIFRVLLYIPSIIGSVVIAGVFESFVAPNGVLGYVLKEVFNVARVPNWFNETAYANKMLLFYTYFFGISGQYLLYSGAMARVPQEVHEAAAMDGITMWKEIWYLDIPLMWPTISMTIVGSFAGIFGASGPILLFTPNFEHTFTFGYWIFDQVRVYGSYYLPSSLGLLFTLIAFPVCLLVKNIVTRIYADVE